MGEVSVNVKINTAEAEAKLRALEARARTVTAALNLTDRSALPTSRTGVNTPTFVERPGSRFIVNESPLGNIKDTTVRGIESTAFAAIVGGGVAGTLSTGARSEFEAGESAAFKYTSKNKGFRRGLRRALYPFINVDPGFISEGPGISREFAQEIGRSFTLQDELNLARQTYRMQRPRYGSSSRRAGLLGAPSTFAEALSLRAQFSPTAQTIRKSFPTLLAGGKAAFSKAGLSLTAAFGVGILARGMDKARQDALDAELLNPGSFSYDKVLRASIHNSRDQVRSAFNSALRLGLGVGGLVLEGSLNTPILREIWGPTTTDSATIAREIQNAVDYYSGGGVEAERQKALSKMRDIWSAGLVSTRFKAIEYSNKVSHNQALRALQIGFSYGPGRDIESRIRNEITDKVITKALRDYQRANPEPTMKDMIGKKD